MEHICKSSSWRNVWYAQGRRVDRINFYSHETQNVIHSFTPDDFMKANIYGLKVNDMKQKKKIDLSLTEPFLMLTDKSDWGANTTNEIRTCFVYIPIKDGNLTFLGTREEDIDFGKYDHHAVKGMFKFSENILVYGETDTIVENTIKYDVQPSETQRKVEKLIERLSKTGEFNYVSSSDEDCLFRLLKVADVRVHKS